MGCSGDCCWKCAEETQQQRPRKRFDRIVNGMDGIEGYGSAACFQVVRMARTLISSQTKKASQSMSAPSRHGRVTAGARGAALMTSYQAGRPSYAGSQTGSAAVFRRVIFRLDPWLAKRRRCGTRSSVNSDRQHQVRVYDSWKLHLKPSID